MLGDLLSFFLYSISSACFFLFLHSFDLWLIVLLLLLLIHWSTLAQGSLSPFSFLLSFNFLFVFSRIRLHSIFLFLIVLYLRFLRSGCFYMLSMSPYNVNMWWRWWRDDCLLYKILLPVFLCSVLCPYCALIAIRIETKELFNAVDVCYHPIFCVSPIVFLLCVLAAQLLPYSDWFIYVRLHLVYPEDFPQFFSPCHGMHRCFVYIYSILHPFKSLKLNINQNILYRNFHWPSIRPTLNGKFTVAAFH